MEQTGLRPAAQPRPRYPKIKQMPFNPGFRFSARDAVVLAVGVACAVGFSMTTIPWFGLIIAMVVGHFFLFCNVFRLPRFLELTWAGVFVLVCILVLFGDAPNWPVWLAVICACTVVIVSAAMRMKSYHGVMWHRINPDLPKWWQSQV